MVVSLVLTNTHPRLEGSRVGHPLSLLPCEFGLRAQRAWAWLSQKQTEGRKVAGPRWKASSAHRHGRNYKHPAMVRSLGSWGRGLVLQDGRGAVDRAPRQEQDWAVGSSSTRAGKKQRLQPDGGAASAQRFQSVLHPRSHPEGVHL